MYADNGKIVIHKELVSFEKFFNAFKEARKNNQDKTFVLHFRIATHGKIDLPNCHPFEVNENLAFCHNGIINISNEKHESDTASFNKLVLKELPKDFIKNEAILYLVENALSGSKLVFLDSEGDYTILNEDEGLWKYGCWFSNRSFEETAQIYVDKWAWRDELYPNFQEREQAQIREIENYCYECGCFLEMEYEKQAGMCFECLGVYGLPKEDEPIKVEVM
jgi:predicted glutamine amidotransferase